MVSVKESLNKSNSEKSERTLTKFKRDMYYQGLFVKITVEEKNWQKAEVSDTPFLKDCYDKRHIGEIQPVNFRVGQLDEFNRKMINQIEGITMRIPDLELILEHKSFLDSLRNQRIFETIRQWAEKNGFRNPWEQKFYILKPEVYLHEAPCSSLDTPYESGILELDQ